MPTYTLASSEQTITESSDQDVIVTNCFSFQNISGDPIRWSTEPFSPTNLGALTEQKEIELFSSPQNTYFKKNNYNGTLIIHVRSVQL
jgi:hypothetical protein